MRRQIIILLALLFVVVPVAAQDWPGAYPEELWGQKGNTAHLQKWVAPAEMRNTPWSMPDMPCPPRVGYVTDFFFSKDGMFLEVQMGMLTSKNGRFTAPPPPGYEGSGFFKFDPQCGCYLEIDDSGEKLKFEAWTFHFPSNEKCCVFASSQWTTGCLRSPGHIGTWLEEDSSCVWSVYSLEVVPPTQKAIHGASRAERPE